MNNSFRDYSEENLLQLPNEGPDIPIFIDPESFLLSKPENQEFINIKNQVIEEFVHIIPLKLKENLHLIEKITHLVDNFKLEYLLDLSYEKQLLKRYFYRKDFKLKKEKEELFEAESFLKACIVSVMSYIKYFKELDYDSTEELIQNYPDFDGLDKTELDHLLLFRNRMATALRFIPARLNKGLLLNLCAKLEGSGNVYITGGNQLPATNRRVAIYEREGGVSPKRKIRPGDK